MIRPAVRVMRTSKFAMLAALMTSPRGQMRQWDFKENEPEGGFYEGASPRQRAQSAALQL
jgi:hypothetical protein